MDYGKYKFEQSKKAHSAKKKQRQIQVKEIKFRPNTEEADYQVKLKSLVKFLWTRKYASSVVVIEGVRVCFSK